MIEERRCKECGKAFKPWRKDQVFDHPGCKATFLDRKYREMRAWWRKHEEELKAGEAAA